MKLFLLVCLGGAVGSGARYGAQLGLEHLAPRIAAGFPWATLVVNLIGCFGVGLGTALLGREGVKFAPELQAALLVGLCGGLTTFSTFANQSVALPPGRLLLNLGVSVAGGLALAWLGLTLGGGGAQFKIQS